MSELIDGYLFQERCLRATQYLPDIVKLQRSLYDAFHHRMDRKEAKMITFGQYLKTLRNGIAFVLAEQHSIILALLLLENTHNEFSEKFESLRRAWALVGSDLKTHGEAHQLVPFLHFPKKVKGGS